MTDLPADDDRTMARLLTIMARLRDPEKGCPWDIVQTFDTIAPYTIEEAYEVADAIARADYGDLRDELGDLLLQVVYHARIAEEEGRFAFADVARAIGDKMIRRHPHVFGPEADGRSPDEQTIAWEEQKATERKSAGVGGTLGGVALGLPALTRALKLQKRLARVGFDWPETENVLDKIVEEAAEIVAAGHDPDALEDEVGDLLFTLVNLARRLDVDPEAALRRTNAKVQARFARVEARLAEAGKTPGDADLAEMDALWTAAKGK